MSYHRELTYTKSNNSSSNIFLQKPLKESLTASEVSYLDENINNKFISYDAQTGEVQSRFCKEIEEIMKPKYCIIGEDLQILNNKLEQLEQCFLNMSTINNEDKENIKPGMMRKPNKNSRQGSKATFQTKRNSFTCQPCQSHQSTKRISHHNSSLQTSLLKQSNKHKQKQISKIKKQIFYCRKSLNTSHHKKQILQKKVDDYSQKIKNYKILQRKYHKLQIDYSKIVKTLQKSQEVRLKQKSLLEKYQFEIKKLNKLTKK